MKEALTPNSKLCNITAIVTAYQRIDQTLVTIQKLLDCEPQPNEIIVHVDANQTQCEKAIRAAFPALKVLLSEASVGPGGGRNKLIAAASNEYIASFDDDSYPIDADYFARVLTLFEKFPAAAILCAAVYHQRQPIENDTKVAEWTSDFGGGACIYRRTAFTSTGGYVPLPVAYGMEEVDLALRLHAQGGRILRSTWLRVFHDTDLQRHAHPEVTAGSIANIALLVYLRYPHSFWPVGFVQGCRRILWLLRHNRRHGILTGLLMTPKHLWSHRKYRQRLTARDVKSYLSLRRAPIKEVL